MKKIIVGISSVCLAAAISAGGYLFYQHPVKYLSVDINPSVELGVNAFNTVVSAEGYNDDGQTILEGQDVTNTSVADAVDTLVKSAADNGFIADDGSTVVSVTAETDNDTDAAKLTDEAEQGVDSAMEGTDNQAVVYKDNVALSRRNEARQLGITPGKLNLIQKLQALDPTITVDQYKGAKVTEIMRKTVELRKEVKAGTSTTETGASSADTTTVTSATDAAYQDIENAVALSEKNKSDKANGSGKKGSSSTTAADAAQVPGSAAADTGAAAASTTITKNPDANTTLPDTTQNNSQGKANKTDKTNQGKSK